MLKLQKFSYSYNQHPIFQDINLEIPSSKIIAVIGQNGSGKSTLAQVLAGLRRDFSGKVYLDEIELKRHTPTSKIRQKVSLVLQNPDNQIIFQKVRDDLTFVLDNLNIAVDKQAELITSALEEVGMSDFIDANPRELSGGQKQRIVIASAILTKPKYLILDEATSMLDPSGKRAIYNILQNLKKQGITTILVTNWLDEIAIADNTLILDQRKIYQYSRSKLLEDLSVLECHHLEVPLTLKLLKSPEGRKFLC